MLTLILIVALLILIVSVLIAALRRYDANNYFDQDRQPFYAEPDALVAAGLLYSQRDRDQQEQHTYTVTPAGEAGLRAWLREPTNDPGFLHHYFGGLASSFQIDSIVDRRSAIHRSRLAEYERIELLLVNRPEWRYALAACRVGIRFERECLEFWAERAAQDSADEEDGEGRRPQLEDRSGDADAQEDEQAPDEVDARAEDAADDEDPVYAAIDEAEDDASEGAARRHEDRTNARTAMAAASADKGPDDDMGGSGAQGDNGAVKDRRRGATDDRDRADEPREGSASEESQQGSDAEENEAEERGAQRARSRRSRAGDREEARCDRGDTAGGKRNDAAEGDRGKSDGRAASNSKDQGQAEDDTLARRVRKGRTRDDANGSDERRPEAGEQPARKTRRRENDDAGQRGRTAGAQRRAQDRKPARDAKSKRSAGSAARQGKSASARIANMDRKTMEKMPKDKLYALSQKVDVEGRSRMTKRELIDAIDER